MKIYKTTVLMLGILIFFTACVTTPATPPAKLKPYPFTQNISNISCEKLTARLIDLQKNNESLYPTQEKLARKDRGIMAGSIIGGMFLIPIPFLIKYVSFNGDRITALAIQRNNGEINAIKRELDSERCT